MEHSVNERFFSDFNEGIVVDGDSHIHLSYKNFINYFSSLKVIDLSNVIIGAYFTYGWMPTMLTLNTESNLLNEIVDISNKVKNGAIIATEEIGVVAKVINNSIVGASKYLHFVNPNLHAIWDSRVYSYLHQKKPYGYRVSCPNTYLEYLNILNQLSFDERFASLKKNLERDLDYEITNNRAGELAMFVMGAPLATKA